jgi:hypothetical protein
MSRYKGRRGRPKKKKVKKVLDEQKFKEYSRETPTLVACRNCAEYNLLCIINYGEDRLDAYSRNNIAVTCPICGYDDVAEDIDGNRLWLPYHLEPVRKRLHKQCPEVREAQPDDPIKFARPYARG